MSKRKPIHPPFAEHDWDRVVEAGCDIVNASACEDEVLHQAAINALRYLLEQLSRTYGRHPVLTETLADFVDDPAERVGLYRQAQAGAEEIEYPLHTIQISFAETLLESMDDPQLALQELLRGKNDLYQYGDRHEREQFYALERKCIDSLRARSGDRENDRN